MTNLGPRAGIAAYPLPLRIFAWLLLIPVAAFAQTAAVAPLAQTAKAPAGPGAGRPAAHTATEVGLVAQLRLSEGDAARGFYELPSDVGPQTQSQQTAPQAPPAPSLQGLGFPASETQANPAEQARLNRRSHMLQIHQKLGLLTAIPLTAALVSGAFAGGRSTSRAGRNLHVALGTISAGMYAATAYYAMMAPGIKGTKKHGPIKAHVNLVWIHLPGMILTPILGAMAYSQKSRGERVHGIARYHGAVAVITYGAYMAALLEVARPHFFSNASHRAGNFFSGAAHDSLALLGLEHTHAAVATAALR